MPKKKIIIINGPNLNLTGKRETDIYGDISFESFLKKVRSRYFDVQIDYYQSNVEGEIINKIHECGFDYDGIVLNAGAYTHTSLAIGDAVGAISSPVVEVHISNIYSREEVRSRSFVAPVAKGLIIGFGLESYRLAIESISG